jgi:hypothetical protein
MLFVVHQVWVKLGIRKPELEKVEKKVVEMQQLLRRMQQELHAFQQREVQNDPTWRLQQYFVEWHQKLQILQQKTETLQLWLQERRMR